MLKIAVVTELITSMYLYGLALAVSLLAAETFKRLGQSEVIGQVLVGILLGPYILGLIHPNEIFNFISEIGALTLLLIAGLETDIRVVLKSGLSVIVLALGGAFFTILLVFPIVYMLSNNLILSLYVSVTLAATSISLTVRIFSEFGKLRSQEAQIIIMSAVFDDLIVIFLLIFVIDLAITGLFTFYRILTVTVLVIAFFIITVILGILFTIFVNPLLNKLESKGALIIFVFSFGLLFGYFASLMGFSPIIGAYFAGLMLAEVDLKHEILEGISPIAFVTVPIFLVNIGLKVNVSIIQEALFIGALLSVAAIMGKIFSGFPAGKIQKIERKSSMLLGAALVPRAEVVLVFASIGLELGVLNDPWYSSLVVVVLLTTFLTPIILKYLLVGGDKPDE